MQAIITRKNSSPIAINVRTITYKNNSKAYTEPFKAGSQLKFINESVIGNTGTVNNCTLQFEYSDDGAEWNIYPIKENTVQNVEKLDFSFVNSSYPDALRWQYNKNNNCEFVTNEKHAYWRAKAIVGNDTGYGQNFIFKQYYKEIQTEETVL